MDLVSFDAVLEDVVDVFISSFIEAQVIVFVKMSSMTLFVCCRCGAALSVVPRVIARACSSLSSVAFSRHHWRAIMYRAKINPPLACFVTTYSVIGLCICRYKCHDDVVVLRAYGTSPPSVHFEAKVVLFRRR